jgi:hypothetical protein
MASPVSSKQGGAFVAPSSAPQFSEAYPDRGQMGRLTERVTFTAGSAYATLNGKLPARCRVMMTALKVVAAVTLGNSGASGTSVLCDTLALVNSLPDTTVSSTTTTMVMCVSAAGSTSTATATTGSRTIAAGTSDDDAKYAAGEQLTSANAYNTASTETTLYVVPMDTGGSEDFHIIGGTATNGYFVGNTGQVDVTVWYQSYTTLPAA